MIHNFYNPQIDIQLKKQRNMKNKQNIRKFKVLFKILKKLSK